jgi:hypothetical protein
MAFDEQCVSEKLTRLMLCYTFNPILFNLILSIEQHHKQHGLINGLLYIRTARKEGTATVTTTIQQQRREGQDKKRQDKTRKDDT